MDLNIDVTSNFRKHFEAKRKIVISQGGARSGKTYSILQCLIIKALSQKNLVISVVAENLPVIKRGALRDFKDILTKAGLYKQQRFNKSDGVYKFENGSIVEFFSIENPTRALGSARDVLFVNECNNVAYETVFQLMARTRKQIYLDFNPVSEFWVHTEIMNNDAFKGDWDFIKTTFKGNEYLDESIKKTLLARAEKDENFKRVYIDGELGNVEGLIYPNYKLINAIPDQVKLRSKQYFGLDWGYSEDPLSLNEIYIIGNNEQPVIDIYVNELVYQSKLQNRQISTQIKKHINSNKNYIVIADSSEPKSIDELFSYSINIEGVTKGAGSINYGINLLKQANIYITKQSFNTIKEIRNYKYSEDRGGKVKRDAKGNPIPIDLFNHSLDNIRYVAMYVNDQKFQYKRLRRPSIKEKSGLIAI